MCAPALVRPDHPVGAAWRGSAPAVLGYNRVTAKPEATVVATVDDDVLIAAAEYGDGRSIVWTTDIGPHWCPVELSEWEGFEPVMGAMIRWLHREIVVTNDTIVPPFGAIPIVLDCDPGHDDAIALLLAVGSPAIDLRAVTTTFGNCSVEDATRNALRILTLAGATDIPVGRGASGSLAGSIELGNYVHGMSGLDGPDLPEPGFAASELTAVELIERVLADAKEPVTLVATGPITNVATLLRRDAVDRSRIREVIFMGGSVDRGNHTPTAEFNTYADPEALGVVLGSGLPVRMVGLNLTHQALATPEVVDQDACDGTPRRAGRRGMDGVLRVVVSGDLGVRCTAGPRPLHRSPPSSGPDSSAGDAVSSPSRQPASGRAAPPSSISTVATNARQTPTSRSLWTLPATGISFSRRSTGSAEVDDGGAGPTVLERHGRMTIDGTPGRHAAPSRPRRARPRLDVLTGYQAVDRPRI